MKINKDFMAVMRAGKVLSRQQLRVMMANRQKYAESAFTLGVCMFLTVMLIALAVLMGV